MILAGDEEPQARQGVAAGFRHALMKAGDGGKQKSRNSVAGDPASCGLDRPYRWWRWAELNRRPKALHPQHYMLSSPLDLVPEQHGAQSASGNQPVVF